MTTTSHALTGAMIGSIVKKPYLALPLAFLSHFVCDMLPHFGLHMIFGSQTMFLWLFFDGLALLAFSYYFWRKQVNNLPLLAASGFAAMSPDLAWLYYGLQGSLNDLSIMDPINRIHSRVQWFEHPIGILVELLWASLMVWIILKQSRSYESNQNPAAISA